MIGEKLNILVVDDDKQMADTITDILMVKGFDAEAAYTGENAAEKIRGNSFDCVLTDVKMPGMNGVELHQCIRECDPDLPVVFMTAYAMDSLVRKGLEEGAIAMMPKPLDINMLLTFLGSLRKVLSIVIVDDDPEFLHTMGDILRRRALSVIELADPGKLQEFLVPDNQIILLDMKLDGTTGLKVLEDLRKEYAHIPVIVITGEREEMAEAVKGALKFGAFTCFYKPFQVDDLLDALRDIRKQELAHMLGRPKTETKTRGGER